jgi:hypothetical protein
VYQLLWLHADRRAVDSLQAAATIEVASPQSLLSNPTTTRRRCAHQSSGAAKRLCSFQVSARRFDLQSALA